jgi:hypothetical protein
MIMAVPLAMGAAFLLQRMFWRKGIPGWLGMAFIAIFALGIAAQSAAEAGVSDLRRTADDTRYQFAQWAPTELPNGAQVIVTPWANYLFSADNLRPGTRWATWDEEVLSHWNMRAYYIKALTVPPTEVRLPDVKAANYAVIDSWSVDELKTLGTPAAKDELALLDAARAQGKVVKTFAEPQPGYKGLGPSIDVIGLPTPVAPPEAPSADAGATPAGAAPAPAATETR